MSDVDPLDSLAESVAEGRPVDFEGARRSVPPEDLGSLGELQLLEAIAGFHREIQEKQIGTKEAPLFIWGELRVLERVGGGAFGEVYSAWEPSLDREVALKLLRQRLETTKAEDTIIREGSLLARVHHQNVLAVYGAARHDDRVGIWSEFLRGRTLAQIMDRDGSRSASEASGIGEALCRALTAVHRQGLLHRDIKAQNVMRATGGRIVLMDFGLGREVTTSQAQEGLELAGTPVYMAPELFKGASASVPSDIYSVGVLLFYLVTGHFPVRGRTIPEIAVEHDTGRYQRLPDLRDDLPERFQDAVNRALQPKPADRFQTAIDLATALAGTSTIAPPPVVPWWGHRFTAVPVAVLLVALVGVALLLMRMGPVPPMLWLTLTAPEGATFLEGSRNVPAVSPDGQNIAFIAKKGEDDMLWVQALGEQQARPIPNTNGAVRPFWSPDGRSLAYFVNQGSKRGLWRVDASGAKPDFLTPGTESRGGTWSRNGTLLLALDPHHGLQAMGASSGTLRWITNVDATAGESQHMWPQFVGDGQHFIYLVLSGNDDIEGVYFGSLTGGERPKLLVKTHTSAIAVGSVLLYTTNGRLFAQSFDATAGTLTGTPHALNLDVDSTYDWLLVLGASQNGTLVFRQPQMRQLTWYDREGHEQEPLGRGRFRNPVISPDGRYVVVERYNLDSQELVAFELSQGRPQSLSLPKHPSCPIWSPDGHLAFAAAPNSFADLYVTDIHRPRDWKLLVQSDKDKEVTGWSSDGRTLAYEVFEPGPQGRNQDLWLFSLADGRPTQFATSSAVEVGATFSPGGHWIAYVSNEEGKPNIYVRRPGDELRYKVSAGPALDPLWESDDTLLCLDMEGYLWRITIPLNRPTQPSSVRLFRTPVKTPGTSRNNYALTPDKTRLLFNGWPDNVGPPMTFSVILNWHDQP